MSVARGNGLKGGNAIFDSCEHGDFANNQKVTKIALTASDHLPSDLFIASEVLDGGRHPP